MMNSKSRLIVSSLTLFSLSILSGCGESPEVDKPQKPPLARPAKITEVVSAGISAKRIYPGTLEASQKSDLAFRVGGELVELPAQSGMVVKKGEMLARLDEAEYKNALDDRQARYDLAKVQFDQAQQMLEKGLGSQIQLDQTKAELKAAKSALVGARDNLAYTQLFAPFDGTVARVDVENHQTVKAQSTVLQLVDTKQLEVHFSVPETLITQLRKEDDPEAINSYCGLVRFNTHADKVFRACHKEHESVPDALTRTYAVVFSLEPIKLFPALPGMSVSVDLDLTPMLSVENLKGVLVPIEAVFEHQGNAYVWRVDEQMQARRVQVAPGKFDGNKLQIKEGLAVGDKIISAGVSYVQEGMPVRPLIKERGL